MKYIKKFSEVSLNDIPLVGGKNASLGDLITRVNTLRVPDGFAVTATAYRDFLHENNFTNPLKKILSTISDVSDIKKLQGVGQQARALLLSGTFSTTLEKEIEQAYSALCTQYNTQNLPVAVRSSATAEDLPTASFAGQQESYLNVQGIADVLLCCKKAMASLFTDRAIVYRIEKGFDHFAVALSVGIQKMVRADLGAAGVAFSLETETGFKNIITINGSFGFGEALVQGLITPDEFLVHKPTLQQGYNSIVSKRCGTKKIKIVCSQANALRQQAVPDEQQHQFCLTNEEIVALAKQVLIIEEHYSAQHNTWTPVDIEWAKDGVDQHLYITQARPETVHSTKKSSSFYVYQLDGKTEQKTIVAGQAIGQSIAQGTVRILSTIHDAQQFNKGDVLVTTMTNPDWTPILQNASAIVTEQGGRTCHAAIVSRELGIPAVIGASQATTLLKNDQKVTVDCSQGQEGFVYADFISFSKKEVPLTNARLTLSCPVMLNIADPSQAFNLSYLPVAGVGLVRTEFIIARIGIHPLAIVNEKQVTDPAIRNFIYEQSRAYKTPKDFFIAELSHGVATIAAAFYPRPVLVRLSDLKSDEYYTLKGGHYFEQKENNPMLGFRGASRYCSTTYHDAFQLECTALQQVRSVMGLKNLNILVPFIRTIDEAKTTLDALAQNGLVGGEDSLKIFMMCEVPSNVVLINDYILLFSGYSIGSNDLTQLTLGIDRNSNTLAQLFNEQDPAMLSLYQAAIVGSHRHKKSIGSCGQGPAEYPELAQFLIDNGIDYLSFDRDAIFKYLA
jgi:pyruvate,water dikinase